MSLSIHEELVFASGLGEVDRVIDLLAKGAEVDYLDWGISTKRWSETPLTAAVRPSFNRTPQRDQRKRKAIVQALLTAGANINLKDQSSRTPLMWAVFGQNIGIINTLLEAGATIDAQDCGGDTALHTAASEDLPNTYVEDYGVFAEIVRVLLAAGADSTILNGDGKTAEDMATGESRKILVAHRECILLRQVAGIDDQEPAPPAQRRM